MSSAIYQASIVCEPGKHSGRHRDEQETVTVVFPSVSSLHVLPQSHLKAGHGFPKAWVIHL